MGKAAPQVESLPAGSWFNAPCPAAGTSLPHASLGARLLARTFPAGNWCTPAIRQLIDADPAFGLELLRRGDAIIHVLALVHMTPERLPCDAAARAHMLMSTGYRTLIGRVAGLPQALVPVLGKLGRRVLKREAYELLIELAGRLETWRRLRHFRRIEAEQLRLLAELPAAYAGAIIVRRVRRERERRFVLSAVQIAESLRGGQARPQLAASLVRVPDFKALHAWVRAIHATQEFPAPPWNGSARLRPVTTGAALSSIAREFGNCAGVFIDDVYACQMYFYHWNNPRFPVLVAIRRDTYFGWVIHELKGPKNRDVPPQRAEEIRREIAAAGVVNVYADSTVLDRWEF